MPSHTAIARRAAIESVQADDTLRRLGFTRGILSPLIWNGTALPAERWIGQGATLEDKPDPRVLNHFHDPRQPWTEAGLRVFLIQVGQSSALWQQNASQDASGSRGGGWSWQDARRRFHLALTTERNADREAELAGTFRNLGQVMHLLQDASVPAHVRNDPHLYKTAFGFDIGNPDGYERWVDKLSPGSRQTYLALGPIGPPDAIFSGSSPPEAPVPVARLIDADRYDGANPDVTTEADIGLAEYTNANFFSGDTIFSDKEALLGWIPFPARASMELGPREYVERLGQYRRYFWKVRHGETGYRTAVPSALHDYLPDALKADSFALDDRVFQDYATRLLPRAVGYSTSLLDYFFRGSLEARVTLTADSAGTRGTLQLTNRTPGEPMDGTFTVYAEDRDGRRRPIAGAEWTRTLAPDQATDPLSFPLPGDTALASWLVVFRGKLGSEGGPGQEPVAVAARLGGPTYQLRLTYWALSSSQGLYEEDDQDLRFLGLQQYTGPGYYAWSTSVDKHDYRGLGVPNDPFTGVSRDQTLFHRDLTSAPGDAAQLQVDEAACYSELFTSNQRPYFYERTDGPPITISVLEFEEPRDVAELLAYRGTVLPGVRRTLGTFTFSVPSGLPVSVPINLDGARFVGLETDDPAALPDLGWPPYWRADARCSARASLFVPQ